MTIIVIITVITNAGSNNGGGTPDHHERHLVASWQRHDHHAEVYCAISMAEHLLMIVISAVFTSFLFITSDLLFLTSHYPCYHHLRHQ